MNLSIWRRLKVRLNQPFTLGQSIIIIFSVFFIFKVISRLISYPDGDNSVLSPVIKEYISKEIIEELGPIVTVISNTVQSARDSCRHALIAVDKLKELLVQNGIIKEETIKENIAMTNNDIEYNNNMQDLSEWFLLLKNYENTIRKGHSLQPKLEIEEGIADYNYSNSVLEN